MTNTIKISSISSMYNCSFDMLSDYAPEYIKSLDDDARDFLAGFEDYESFGYTVINDCIVVCSDSLSGDVYNITPLDEFIKQTAAYLEENADMYRD